MKIKSNFGISTESSTSSKVIKETDVWDPNDTFATDDSTADFEEPVISHPLRKISFSELRDAIRTVEDIMKVDKLETQEQNNEKKDTNSAEITFSDSGTLNQPSLATIGGKRRLRRLPNFVRK